MTASRKVKSNPAMVQIEIIDGKILSAIAEVRFVPPTCNTSNAIIR